MKPIGQQQSRKSILTISLTFLLLFLSSPLFSQDEPVAKKGLERELDPVIIIGKELHHLLGTRIDHLALLRYRDNNFELIPFQVDERDSEGRFIMTEGEEAGTDDDEGCLDENDELVFMARDLGDREISDDWQQQYDGSVEIEVVDPLTGGKGWVYLVATPSAAERSPVDYVKFEFQNNIACVFQKYAFSCTDYSLNYKNHASFIRENGEFNPNTLDRMKLRIKFELLEHLSGISFSFNEEQFDIDLIGYRDASVRVIVRKKHKMKVFGITISVRNSEKIYYPYYSIDPYTVGLPFNCSRYMKRVVVKGYSDSNNRNMNRRAFFSERNVQPVTVDGVMSPAEQQLDRSTTRWTGITAPGRTFIQIYKFDQELLKQAEVKLYYLDDWDAEEPPEGERGQTPGLGVEIDITNLEKGTYQFANYQFSLRGEYHRGDEQACLNIFDHPLKVKVRKIASGKS